MENQEKTILDVFIEELRKFGIAKAARIAGLPKATVYDWVYGLSIPTMTNAIKVADAMGLEFLLFEKEW